ncbi:hypothetical protein Lal_00001758 [Lupinus albus]|uniref:DUF7870 domain-containing protein n=1 Tax=Lupinus albus TaxID=3870 RepID=A0A6A4PQD5_LUPAL|nr:hypothetical protein Lalb_Chr11g0065081 [Lupinus albus]KAF1893302.1 hypothetical protein Lal_00001758 [Lupinus albus]
MVMDLIDATTMTTKTKYFFNNNNKNNKPVDLYKESRYLIIRLPNSQFSKICYRLLFLALAFASFHGSLSFIDRFSSSTTQQVVERVNYSSSMDQLLSILFRDLTNEGVMKQTQQKAVFISNDEEGKVSQVVNDYNMDLVPLNDMVKQNSVVLDNTLDFVFTTNFPESSEFIERTLKSDGVVTILLINNPSATFYKPENYRIAYMRRFDDLIAVALKKTSGVDEVNFAVPRKLFGYASEAKKAALLNLEDVLLEPPRAASGKSRVYLKRTRYLPDLMGDTLESYSRRVFIDVGLPEKDGGSETDWFSKNYPTRNKNFEIYKIETTTDEASGKEVPQIGISDWVRKNVKEEEYVVMKAEAEVVEEMMRNKLIGLVDELFLECKPHGPKQTNNKSRRAYWECLALYGKLRDEGVAVHQWWG